MFLLHVLDGLGFEEVEANKGLQMQVFTSLSFFHKELYLSLQLLVLFLCHQFTEFCESSRQEQSRGGLQINPVYSRQKRMQFNLSSTISPQPLRKIFVKKLADEVFCLSCDHSLLLSDLWPFDVEVSDVIDHLFDGLGTKRPRPDDKLVGHDS